jgi:hypothetical protein
VNRFTDDQSSCCRLLRSEIKEPRRRGHQVNSSGVGNETRRQFYPKYRTSQGKAGTSDLGQEPLLALQKRSGDHRLTALTAVGYCPCRGSEATDATTGVHCGLGGTAALPVPARAQQATRLRRIGVLMAMNENDPEPKAELSGFTQWLAELGWTDGRNLRIDVRWGAGNFGRMQQFAKELVGLQPDVILRTHHSSDRCIAERGANDPDRIL